jgi:hypothetical protein
VHAIDLHIPANFGADLTEVHFIGLKGEFMDVSGAGWLAGWLCAWPALPAAADAASSYSPANCPAAGLPGSCCC